MSDNTEDAPIDYEKTTLDELLVKPSPNFILKSKDAQKEIFMSYNLLMDMQAYATEEPIKWELAMLDKSIQMEILQKLTQVEDETNKTVVNMPDFNNFVKFIDVGSLMELFAWLQDHVSDFFTTRFFNLERRKNRPQMKKQRSMMTHLSKDYSKLIKSVEEKK